MERRDARPPGAATRDLRRRAHLDLRGCRDALRDRVQQLLPRPGPSRRRGPGLLPGPCLTRHVLPCLPRGQADRDPARRLPPGGLARAERTELLPAPAPHARLLAVPHGVDGTRADQRDLPGADEPLPPPSGDRRHLRAAGVGVPRRRRDGRTRIARGPAARGERGPGQPHLRRQLQPPAPRRARARQRQDRPGARSGLHRRRLERHQGPLGSRVGLPALCRPHGRSRADHE